jgi:hypothetical protein
MSPETILLTLRAQEVMAQSRRICRQTTENICYIREYVRWITRPFRARWGATEDARVPDTWGDA